MAEQENRAPLDSKRTLYTRNSLDENVLLQWALLTRCFIVIIHPLRNIFLFCHQRSTMEPLLRKVTPMCLPSCKNEVWHSSAL